MRNSKQKPPVPKISTGMQIRIWLFQTYKIWNVIKMIIIEFVAIHFLVKWVKSASNFISNLF